MQQDATYNGRFPRLNRFLFQPVRTLGSKVKGLFSAIGNGVLNAVSSVGNAIVNVVKAVAYSPVAFVNWARSKVKGTNPQTSTADAAQTNDVATPVVPKQGVVATVRGMWAGVMNKVRSLFGYTAAAQAANATAEPEVAAPAPAVSVQANTTAEPEVAAPAVSTAPEAAPAQSSPATSVDSVLGTQQDVTAAATAAKFTAEETATTSAPAVEAVKKKGMLTLLSNRAAANARSFAARVTGSGPKAAASTSTKATSTSTKATSAPSPTR